MQEFGILNKMVILWVVGQAWEGGASMDADSKK